MNFSRDRHASSTAGGLGIWHPLLLAALLQLTPGCGTNFPEVRGKVTLDSEPLPDAFVEFYPKSAGQGSVSYGKTDQSGTYIMQFSESTRGVMAGEYIVRIHTGDVYDDHGKIKRVPELVPQQYNRKSTLTATVSSQGPNEFDFDLKSEGRVVEQKVLEGS